jgi:hypothetical protein
MSFNIFTEEQLSLPGKVHIGTADTVTASSGWCCCQLPAGVINYIDMKRFMVDRRSEGSVIHGERTGVFCIFCRIPHVCTRSCPYP